MKTEDVQLEDEKIHLNDALVQPLDVLEFLEKDPHFYRASIWTTACLEVVDSS